MFDRTLNVLPIEGAVNVECGFTASVWSLWPQAGVQ